MYLTSNSWVNKITKNTITVSIFYPKLLTCFGAKKNRLIDKVLLNAYKLFLGREIGKMILNYSLLTRNMFYIYSLKQYISCFTFDGAWSSLTKWTICSTTCGAGTQFRTRRCEFPITAPCGQNCSSDMTYIYTFQLMGRGLNGPTGQYAVQHVGLVHSSKPDGVSFPSQLHVDKTVPLIS